MLIYSCRRSKEEYDLEMMAHRTQEKEEPASTSSSLSDTPPGNACEPQTACDSGTRKTSAVRDSRCDSDIIHI